VTPAANRGTAVKELHEAATFLSAHIQCLRPVRPHAAPQRNDATNHRGHTMRPSANEGASFSPHQRRPPRGASSNVFAAKPLAVGVPGAVPWLARRAAGSSSLASVPALRRSGGSAGSRSHFGGKISRDFHASANFNNNGSSPAHGFLLKRAFPAGTHPGCREASSFGVARHPLFVLDWGMAGEKESFAAAAKLFSQLPVNAGNRRRRIHLKAR
jgi:hypothetical protein